MAIDWEKIANKKAELDNKLGDFERVNVTWFKPESGDNQLRVLPGWDNENEVFAGQFWREVGQHWGVSPEQRGPVLCVEHTPGLEGTCEICEIAARMKMKQNDLEAQERYKKIKFSTSYLMNVVDLDDPEWTARDVARFRKDHPEDEVPFEAGETKVQVFAAGPSIFNQLLTQMATNHLDISDAKDGRDIVVNKTGGGMNTRYGVTVLIKPSEAPAYKALTNLEAVGFQMEASERLALIASSDLPALAASNHVNDQAGSAIPAIQYTEDSMPIAALGEDVDDVAAKLRAQMAG